MLLTIDRIFFKNIPGIGKSIWSNWYVHTKEDLPKLKILRTFGHWANRKAAINCSYVSSYQQC